MEIFSLLFRLRKWFPTIFFLYFTVLNSCIHRIFSDVLSIHYVWRAYHFYNIYYFLLRMSAEYLSARNHILHKHTQTHILSKCAFCLAGTQIIIKKMIFFGNHHHNQCVEFMYIFKVARNISELIKSDNKREKLTIIFLFLDQQTITIAFL